MTELQHEHSPDLLTPTPLSGGALELVELIGPDPGRRSKLGSYTQILGRDPDCDISIDDRRVSRHHARIEPDSDGSLLLVDNASANGTSVNGREVGTHHLDVGDCIQLGEAVVLQVQRAGTVATARVRSERWSAQRAMARGLVQLLDNGLTLDVLRDQLSAMLHEEGPHATMVEIEALLPATDGVQVDLEDPTMLVRVDRTQVEQAMQTLFETFAPCRVTALPLTITTTTGAAPPGDYVAVQIMPDAGAPSGPHPFEAFGSSSNLVLAIARRAIERSGGQLRRARADRIRVLFPV